MTDPTHFLDIDSLETETVEAVLALARAQRDGAAASRPLTDRSLGMLFEKPSTRTRVSFETGMTQLGGHAVFLGPDDTQLDRGEPLKDTARALSGYVDAIMARVFNHENVEELAAYAAVPVINGLTDDAHPCQTLADLLTITDYVDDPADVSVAWVGDGNNVARSFAVGCAMLDIDLTVATPDGYGLPGSVLDRAEAYGRAPIVTTDPEAAVTGADVVYTDVWVSMGQESDRAEKLTAFEGFQVNEALLAHAREDVTVMHCLPAHRGEEISDAVLESDRALVWTQAENRLHAQKALLTTLIEDSS